MKTAKTLSLVLAVVMLLSMLGLASAESTLSAPGELPIWKGAEPEVITILLAPDPYVEDYDNNKLTHWIEESCNVNLEFEYLPTVDALDKLTVMVQTGEKLPDVINVELNAAVAKSYYDAGAILNLKPYYDAGLAYNADKNVANYPDWNLLTNVTMPDGAIYCVPKIQASPSNETKYKMWVNEAWLTNLGIEVPTTTEEFYQMLLRFKNEDANGNGDPNDEIPFITSTGWGGTAYKFLTNSFVFEGDGDMFILDNGHVSTSYLQDGWFEAMNYLKKLADEGLLAKESFTYNNNALKAVAATEEDRVGVMTNSSLAFMGNNDDPFRLRFIPIKPLVGPEGVQLSSYAKSVTTQHWFVTTYAKNPELAFRVGDFIFSEEGFLRGRFGIEGENWMMTEDYLALHPEVEVAAGNAVLGYEGKYLFYNDIHGSVNTLTWYDKMPYFSGNIEAEGAYISKDAEGNVNSTANNCTLRQGEATAFHQLLKPGEDIYVPNLIFTDEELDQIAEIKASILTYVNEQRTNFIIGEPSDLADKELFIKTLKDNFQIDTFLTVADAAYQRQYGNK